jgi:glycosyltransferase involved in cell wall biosynthesis
VPGGLRILVLHSPYLSGPASGENRVVEDEVRLLREGGHEVEVFLPTRRAGQALGGLREGMSAVWSREAVQKVRGMIDRQRFEIVHCHNLFPALSPAVLRAAHDAGAPVLMTLHNYRLACLPATFLRDNRVCEDCLGHVPWRGVVHRCYRGSAAASAALATSLTLHRARGTFDSVDLFLAVSDFMRAKHIEAGLPADRVSVKRNFAWGTRRREGPGEYALFAGRLSPEKGVRTLLDAWRGIDVPLVIAGDGPEGDELRPLAPEGVRFLGAVEAARMPELVAGARALVLPSIWYEGAPRSVLEAYAAGVPVIASSIGGLPDLVEDTVTGLLVPPRDSASLAAAIERLSDDAESLRLGEGAWKEWSERYAPEVALKDLERVYRRALDRRTAGSG